VKEFTTKMMSLYGIQDENRQLYVCTVVKNGFGVKLDDFIKFRERVERAFEKVASPIVLFFTDAKFNFKSEGLNVAPLKGYDKAKEFDQCVRKGLKYQKNSIIYFIPFKIDYFNEDIWIPDERIDFSDGTVLMPIGENGK
jgi:hypothetical protein